MSISSRIHDTIEGWQEEWKDRLRGWMSSWLSWGIELFFDILGKAAAPKLSPLIETMEKTGKIPPELQPLLDEIKNPTGQVGALFSSSAGGALIGGALGKMIDALLLPFAYAISSVTENVILSPGQLLDLWHRGNMTEEKLDEYLSWLGYDESERGRWKVLAEFLPGPSDLVRWQAREVFEPEMVVKYGLDSEFGALRHEDFRKVGVSEEHELNFWRAHWEHASWMQVVEMLHRGLIKEEDVWDWFRLVEIPPYWRQHLIDSAYTWPTRVDVRRWWDMRTIDESELRRLYAGMGYHGVNLDNYVLWTKVYVALPDLMARFTKGWISMEDVRTELVGLGMPAARVEELIQTKVKPSEQERTATERDFTKSDIYKGVKQGVITRGQGLELLRDLGYDEDEADYLLAINIPPDQEEEVIRQRELSKTDIKAGLKREVITEAEARTRLLDLRYNPADVDFLLELYRVVAKPPVDIKLREASKADIVLGVKKGLITQSEAHSMLLDIGYEPEAADFILLVKTEESPFSPKSFEEFKDITAKYRRAAGMIEKPVPEDLKAAADELVKIKLEVDALDRAVKEERRLLIADEEVPDAASAKLKQLQVALNRARAELQRIQLDYNSKVAAWKHGAG